TAEGADSPPRFNPRKMSLLGNSGCRLNRLVPDAVMVLPLGWMAVEGQPRRQPDLLRRGVKLRGDRCIEVYAGVHRDEVGADNDIGQFFGQHLGCGAGAANSKALPLQFLDDV